MSTTDSSQAAAKLLERVWATAKSFEAQYRESGTAYNVFKAAGIGTKETAICRVLADLLNPKGLHYQGSAYLNLFMDTVVKPLVENAGKFDVSKAKVIAEYQTDEGRRIDIVIDDGTIFIPIEVKIYAGEQEKQLADYAAFSKRINTKAGFIPVLFLTLDWYEPNEEAGSGYVHILWKTHIIPWLEKCLDREETGRATPVREMLKQFIKAIKSFCGYMEEEAMADAIKALVTESRDNYAAASLIGKVLEEIDADNNAWEIFKGEILGLVKNKIPDAQYHEDNGWYFLYFPIGKGCGFSVNYDMRWLTVENDEPKKLSADAAGKISKTMSHMTGARDEMTGAVWASLDVKYPGLEGIDNEDVFKYELYKIYSENPQAVADRIVSWVTALKSV